MSEALGPGDFPAFFEALHGHEPFPWQARLVEELGWNSWPEALDLPTGAGKTAAIDVAVFHLAMQAGRSYRSAPLRIAFVVDRRLVVDDAHARAQRIAKALKNPECEAVARVAEALRTFAGEDDPPLVVRRLRGGVPREDDWAHTPSQPTVLCSTVDQVGSRLLFRGYGVTDRMKSVHAGLLGSDALILLDEAHLAEPFHQTLQAIHSLRREQDADLRSAPWRFVQLSATRKEGKGHEKPFRLCPEDRDHPTLMRRLEANKPALLLEDGRDVDDEAFLKAVVEQVERVLPKVDAHEAPYKSLAIGVVLNRVKAARAVFDELESHYGEGACCTLLIGPSRSVERDRLDRELDALKTGRRCKQPLDKPHIVVATQCIEVGVDLDLDALVTQAAPLDALRQRFGRLNRSGREIESRGAVVATKRDSKEPEKLKQADRDPVYGDRTNRAWALLNELAETEGEGKDEVKVVDFGIAAMDGALPALEGVADRIGEASSEAQDAPVFMPAYVDLWAQTSPVPACDPEPALFLHGPQRAQPSVSLIWRADVDPSQGERTAAVLVLVPPRAAEAVEVPLWAARRWLATHPKGDREGRRRERAEAADLADAPEAGREEDAGRGGARAFRWRGADSEGNGWTGPRNLKPNDTLVVPCDYGGCDGFGWKPESTDWTRDVALEAAVPYAGKRFAVRIHEGTIRDALRISAVGEDGEVSNIAPDPQSVSERLRDALGDHRNSEPTEILTALLDLAVDLPGPLRKVLDTLRTARGRRNKVLEAHFAYDNADSDQTSGVILVAPRGVEMAAVPEELALSAPPSTEDDRHGSLPGFDYPLDRHTADVVRFAQDFAHRAGLGEALAADLALAAELHDAGKADERFQAWLAGGDWIASRRGGVLAKSGRRSTQAARSASRLPDRWRHEALSVRCALADPRLPEAHDPGLVAWLVGSHHGHGRPFFPHADPLEPSGPHLLGEGAKPAEGPGPQSLGFAFPALGHHLDPLYAGLDWAQLFEALRRRYGPWELARLEAVLRLADHRASAAAETASADPMEEPPSRAAAGALP